MHLPNIFKAGAYKFLKSTSSVKLFMLVCSNGECALWATQQGLHFCHRGCTPPPNAEMLNIMVCTYLFSILCSIRYSSVHGGRYYKATFVINGIFFPAGKWEAGFSSRCNEGETKPLLEDGDCWSEPRGGLLRDGMRAGQTTTGWAFFVATLSLSFTHSVTPLHALASGCLEPPGGLGRGAG